MFLLEFKVFESPKWSKIQKIGNFEGFQGHETRENPYVLALIQGL